MKIKSLSVFIILTCLFINIKVLNASELDYDTNSVNGFRASRILSSYPGGKFPPYQYWINTSKSIAAKFPGSKPGGVWIVSLYISNGVTQLNFPNNTGKTYPYINFISTDQNEEYLTKFDSAGLRVWLQVEPGAASIDTLIHIVLNRYKHHKCVAGFGIDVEWYNTQAYPGGKKVTNAEAQQWEQKVKSIDSNYTLFLKHYGSSWMPPNYRGNIIFIDDSQGFYSSNPLSQMVNEFKAWGNMFYPNKVGFQIGYPNDSTWWQKYPDPVYTIGNALMTNIPNCNSILWVDFTINKIYPVTKVEAELSANNNIDFYLGQNYPNPFNPSTRIDYYINGKPRLINLKVFDVLGREVAVLVNEIKEAGYHSVNFSGDNLSPGVYYYSLSSGEFYSIKKMTLIK